MGGGRAPAPAADGGGGAEGEKGGGAGATGDEGERGAEAVGEAGREERTAGGRGEVYSRRHLSEGAAGVPPRAGRCWGCGAGTCASALPPGVSHGGAPAPSPHPGERGDRSN